MNEKQLIKKTEKIIKDVLSKVPLKSPHYEMLRELQKDILLYNDRKKIAKSMRKRGATIREIAKELGYKHPGSITYLLN